jgi:hypothetical protein
MHVLIVNFHLKGITEAEFRAMSDELAPTFAAVLGLISKVWLADPDTNTYGGVYLWDNEASCLAYQASELFNAVKSHPNLADVTSRQFGVLDGPSRVTRAAGAALATA